jgi:hypothetical protein
MELVPEGGMRRTVTDLTSRLLMLLPVLLSGCLINQNTRMPQPRPRHPKVERHSYEFHDPFPNAELGPMGGPRPPGMAVPRTEARRAMEQRAAHGGTRPRSFWLPPLPGAAPKSSPSAPLVPRIVPD